MPDEQETVFTVSQLTRDIRSLLEEQIGDVWVEGEVCPSVRTSVLRNCMAHCH
jgi:exonuclease VII large subunit